VDLIFTLVSAGELDGFTGMRTITHYTGLTRLRGGATKPTCTQADSKLLRPGAKPAQLSNQCNNPKTTGGESVQANQKNRNHHGLDGCIFADR
jgi:hypothetical protein